MSPPAQPHAHPRTETPKRLFIVGNGMAAIRTIEDIQAQPGPRPALTVFGAENLGHYNRVQLSSVLAGDKAMAEIITHPPDWYARQGITLHLGDAVTAIDAQAHRLTTASGRCLGWDRLIIATGAEPVIPPLPGRQLANVLGFRDAADVRAMLQAARDHRHAVVVGGGVLGLEAAWGLKAQGMDVTIVHMVDTLMDRQIDVLGGAILRRRLEEQGLTCLTSAQASAIIGSDRVEAVELADGRRLPADLVILAVGIRPRVELARAAGLDVGRGIIVDGHLRTSHPDIHAVGECVEFQGQTFGLVKPLYDMAAILAKVLTGQECDTFQVPAQSTVLKIPAIGLFAAGDSPHAGANESEIVHHDSDRGIYKKVILRHGRVVGTVLIGDTSDSAQFWHWMRNGDDVSHLDQESLCRGCIGCQDDDVAALPDDAIICQCNHVSKGAITQAIRAEGLSDLAQVTARTRAGVTCGQCTIRVAALLAHVQGGPAADLAGLAARSQAMHRAFTWWHRGHCTLMSVLLLTGLGLHFPHWGLNLAGFDWSRRLHEGSGLAVLGGFALFLGLTRLYRRRWATSIDSAAMFVLMPLLLISGVVFLWPGLLPDRLAEMRTTTWVALVHLSFAIIVGMYLIHHLANAPFRWWRKRRQRLSIRPVQPVFLRKGYANET